MRIFVSAVASERRPVEMHAPIALTRAARSKRSSPICSASQFTRIITAARGYALTACARAQSMTADSEPYIERESMHDDFTSAERLHKRGPVGRIGARSDTTASRRHLHYRSARQRREWQCALSQ